MIPLSRRVRPFLVLPTVSAVVSASAQPGGSAHITLPADAEILPMPAWDGLPLQSFSATRRALRTA